MTGSQWQKKPEIKLLDNQSIEALVTQLSTIEVAKKLLGHELIYHGLNGTVGGIITETEAYTENDPASHTFKGKKTSRNAPMFLAPGHLYIYRVYGMHLCLNIVTEKFGIGAAVLIRELTPTVGLDIIQKNRPKVLKKSEWLNGPGKLMMGLGIPHELNSINALDKSSPIQLALKETPISIQSFPRIGISVAKERLWRFRYCNHV